MERRHIFDLSPEDKVGLQKLGVAALESILIVSAATGCFVGVQEMVDHKIESYNPVPTSTETSSSIFDYFQK